MSETKFTPGPWEVSDNDQRRVNVKMNSFLHPSEPRIATKEDIEKFGDDCHDDWNICQCDDQYYMRSPEECEANARLIAAAPDLLTALEQLLAAWVRLGNDTPSMPGFEATVAEVSRAAIAKATGQ